jgi:hypothetical protein
LYFSLNRNPLKIAPVALQHATTVTFSSLFDAAELTDLFDPFAVTIFGGTYYEETPSHPHWNQDVVCHEYWVLRACFCTHHNNRQPPPDSVPLLLLSINLLAFSVQCLNFFSWNLKIGLCLQILFLPQGFTPFIFANTNAVLSFGWEVHSKRFPAKSFQPDSQILSFPHAQTVGWPAHLIFIWSVNTFCVLVVFRFFV